MAHPVQVHTRTLINCQSLIAQNGCHTQFQPYPSILIGLKYQKHREYVKVEGKTPQN